MTECCIKCWLVGAATAIVLMLAAVDARADGTPTPYEQVADSPACAGLLAALPEAGRCGVRMKR